MNLRDELTRSRVVPVITATDIELTVTLCGALAAGGMTCVEITLRTAAALDSIRAVKARYPELLVAAGTVTQPAHLVAAQQAGVDVCISPGISAELLQSADEHSMPFLPGVATASEIMLGMAHGLDTFKLFPAQAIGGMALLKSLHGPFPEVRFCPTGGLGRDNFRDYLALPNVICCGGSWMVTQTLIESGRWLDIEALAQEAVSSSA